MMWTARLITASLAILLGVTTPSAGSSLPSSDPLVGFQWGLQAIGAPQAWRYARGGGVIVAVVDTGVDYRHPDLDSKIRRIWGEKTVCLPSLGNCRYADHGDQGPGSHGTMVAGIIAAETNNRTGIAGVAPDSRIISVAGGGVWGDKAHDSRLAAGIRYAVDRGARVISMSFGVHQSRFVKEPVDELAGRDLDLGYKYLVPALEYAWRKGAVLVAAAGNDAAPYCAYPAFYVYTLCVGATDRRNIKTAYSNFGLQLDVVAPGGSPDGYLARCEGLVGEISPEEEIVSTGAPGSHQCGTYGYRRWFGTSFATPHVSGVAALLLSKGLNNRQVRHCIRKTATDLGAPGYDSLYGYGLANAYRAVRECRA